MTYRFVTSADSRTISIIPIETGVFQAWLKKQDGPMKRWVKSTSFKATPGSISLVSQDDGSLSQILWGVEDHRTLWSYATLPSKLPEGKYQIDARMGKAGATAVALGYVHDGEDVDGAQNPTFTPDQRCDNCVQYAATSDGWGTCNIFPGFEVAGPGWCKVWVVKT